MSTLRSGRQEAAGRCQTLSSPGDRADISESPHQAGGPHANITAGHKKLIAEVVEHFIFCSRAQPVCEVVLDAPAVCKGDTMIREAKEFVSLH